jgi:hypothetical protein
MLGFFSKKNDTKLEQSKIQNIDFMIIDLLKKNEKNNLDSKSFNQRKIQNKKVKQIYCELNSFVNN